MARVRIEATELVGDLRIRWSAGVGGSAVAPPHLRFARPRRQLAACNERGQALLEFAFVIPLLLVFILLLVDFGIAMDRRELMQHAVREGVRRAAVGDTVAEIQNVTHSQSGGSLQVGDVHVCYHDTNDNSIADAGENVRVWGQYEYKFSVDGGGMLAAFGGGLPSIDMSPSAEERLEKPGLVAPKC